MGGFPVLSRDRGGNCRECNPLAALARPAGNDRAARVEQTGLERLDFASEIKSSLFAQDPRITEAANI